MKCKIMPQRTTKEVITAILVATAGKCPNPLRKQKLVSEENAQIDVEKRA